MSVEFRIDKDEGLVIGTLKGEVDVDAVLAGLEELVADEDYSPGLNGLTDLREMKWESEQGDLRKLVHFLIEHRKKIGRSRSAVVVSNGRTFGMARMFEVFSTQSSINVRVFRDLDKAKRWLLDKSAEAEEE
jgi:hypothetical protein